VKALTPKLINQEKEGGYVQVRFLFGGLSQRRTRFTCEDDTVFSKNPMKSYAGMVDEER